jgi:hypothetical protein
MARELGMNPKKLGDLANQHQEGWKRPLPDFIKQLYERRFGRRQPDRVVSIEARASELAHKKALRRQHRAAARAAKARPGSEPTARIATSHTTLSRVSAAEMDVSREATTVVACAAVGEARVISLGPLLFFSTESGDAWVLDPADRLARCLARGGVPLPAGINETADRFSVDWEATYTLDAETFVVADHDGHVEAIVGYPVKAIRQLMKLVETVESPSLGRRG